MCLPAAGIYSLLCNVIKEHHFYDMTIVTWYEPISVPSLLVFVPVLNDECEVRLSRRELGFPYDI